MRFLANKLSKSTSNSQKMSVYQNLIFYSRLYNKNNVRKLMLCSELFIKDYLSLSYGKIGQKLELICEGITK